jgi:hypothetical protein
MSSLRLRMVRIPANLGNTVRISCGQGWQELAGELMPGTIGAELQEWEQQEVEA